MSLRLVISAHVYVITCRIHQRVLLNVIRAALAICEGYMHDSYYVRIESDQIPRFALITFRESYRQFVMPNYTTKHTQFQADLLDYDYESQLHDVVLLILMLNPMSFGVVKSV